MTHLPFTTRYNTQKSDIILSYRDILEDIGHIIDKYARLTHVYPQAVHRKIYNNAYILQNTVTELSKEEKMLSFSCSRESIRTIEGNINNHVHNDLRIIDHLIAIFSQRIEGDSDSNSHSQYVSLLKQTRTLQLELQNLAQTE